MESKISGNSSKVQSGPFPCCVYVKDAQGEYCFQPKCFHTFAENSNMGRGLGSEFLSMIIYTIHSAFISQQNVLSVKLSTVLPTLTAVSPNSKKLSRNHCNEKLVCLRKKQILLNDMLLYSTIYVYIYPAIILLCSHFSFRCFKASFILC